MSRRPRLLALAHPLILSALAATVLSACSTGEPPPSAPPAAPAAGTPAASIDPCTLLHDDEATALLRGAPTRSGPVAENRGTSCTWTTASGNLISVQVYTGRAFYAPDVQGPDARRLTGVGDDAFVDKGLGGAIAGQTVVFVDAVGPGMQGGIETALRTAISRTGAA
jgi:hypothetical protein